MTLTAVLLTGGLSRRMGADKATLLVEGEPLWSRQVRLLRGLKPHTLWVSARTRPLWCPPELELVADVPPSRGPLSGLSSALERLATSHLLALAIDLPLMSIELLRKLWQLAEPGCGVVPQTREWFEPLCTIYPAQAAIEAKMALNSGAVALQHLAKRLIDKNYLRVYSVAPAERAFFYNVNTADELAQLGHLPG